MFWIKIIHNWKMIKGFHIDRVLKELERMLLTKSKVLSRFLIQFILGKINANL